MTSTHGYTDTTKVKGRLVNYDSTGVTDSEIDEFINCAEGIILAVTKNKWKTTIPPLIVSCATDIAALYTLIANPANFTSASEAAFMADVLWAQITLQLKLLSDDSVVEYLKKEG